MEIVFVIRICYNELQNTYKKCKFMTVSYNNGRLSIVLQIKLRLEGKYHE